VRTCLDWRIVIQWQEDIRHSGSSLVGGTMALCQGPHASKGPALWQLIVAIYCLHCTKFHQLILRNRKIIKIVATRFRILRLKCTKFDMGSEGKGRDVTGGEERWGREERWRSGREGRVMRCLQAGRCQRPHTDGPDVIGNKIRYLLPNIVLLKWKWR